MRSGVGVGALQGEALCGMTSRPGVAYPSREVVSQDSCVLRLQPCRCFGRLARASGNNWWGWRRAALPAAVILMPNCAAVCFQAS